MKMTRLSHSILLAAAVALPAAGSLSGCGTAVSEGQLVGLDAWDLQAMAGQMMQSITGSTTVQEAINQPGPMRIVVLPVENRLTGEVLPKGQQRLFVGKLRTELYRARPDDFEWIVNRDDFYALRAAELDNIDLGPAPDAINPEYALTATFRSLTDDTKRGRSAYYSCQFELTSLATRQTLWSDDYQVKKSARKGFLD